MPFVADRRLEDLLDADAGDRCARRIAEDGTQRLVENTRRNTPVDTSPFRDKPGRPRGALRASVHDGPVVPIPVPGARAYRGTARTFDPVAPHVEWTTRPHLIRARKPDGKLRFPDSNTGEPVFRREVRHPGTRGQHMFAIGAAITEAQIDSIARPAIRLFERELVPRRTGRVVNLRGR